MTELAMREQLAKKLLANYISPIDAIRERVITSYEEGDDEYADKLSFMVAVLLQVSRQDVIAMVDSAHRAT